MSQRQKKQTSAENLNHFIDLLSKLDGVEICGVATLLGVKVRAESANDKTDLDKVSPTGELREISTIIEEMIEKFTKESRAYRRRITRIMEKAEREHRKNPVQIETEPVIVAPPEQQAFIKL